ncbi:DoxX family protein [Actinomycetes bacterium M1A6_2h]
MNIVLWVVAGILAVAFLAAGASKLAQDRSKLIKQTPYVEDFPHPAVKSIGVLEIVGAVGLVVPALVSVATVLVPLAATGLALLMVGGVVTHLRRGDGVAAAAPAILLAVLSAFVAWGRFGTYAF